MFVHKLLHLRTARWVYDEQPPYRRCVVCGMVQEWYDGIWNTQGPRATSHWDKAPKRNAMYKILGREYLYKNDAKAALADEYYTMTQSPGLWAHWTASNRKEWIRQYEEIDQPHKAKIIALKAVLPKFNEAISAYETALGSWDTMPDHARRTIANMKGERDMIVDEIEFLKGGPV